MNSTTFVFLIFVLLSTFVIAPQQPGAGEVPVVTCVGTPLPGTTPCWSGTGVVAPGTPIRYITAGNAVCGDSFECKYACPLGQVAALDGSGCPTPISFDLTPGASQLFRWNSQLDYKLTLTPEGLNSDVANVDILERTADGAYHSVRRLRLLWGEPLTVDISVARVGPEIYVTYDTDAGGVYFFKLQSVDNSPLILQANAGDCLRGDYNVDGRVSIQDFRGFRSHVLSWSTLSEDATCGGEGQQSCAVRGQFQCDSGLGFGAAALVCAASCNIGDFDSNGRVSIRDFRGFRNAVLGR